MKVLTPGHLYELAWFEEPTQELLDNEGPGQRIQFIEKRQVPPHGNFETVNNGTTNEEVLAMMIDRMESLNAKLPNFYTSSAIGLLRMTLDLLNQRTAERKARNVEGTPMA